MKADLFIGGALPKGNGLPTLEGTKPKSLEASRFLDAPRPVWPLVSRHNLLGESELSDLVDFDRRYESGPILRRVL